jgi:hypothetical protein
MTDAQEVEAASLRLQRALRALEDAAERHCEQHREVERGRAALAVQVHALDVDRARLADDLDRELARSRRLEGVNRDVSARLDQAIGTIGTVLAGETRAGEAPGDDEAAEA